MPHAAWDVAAPLGRPAAVIDSPGSAHPRGRAWWALPHGNALSRPDRSERLARRAAQAREQEAWRRVLRLTTRILRDEDSTEARVLRAEALLECWRTMDALTEARMLLPRLTDGVAKATVALVGCRAASRLGQDAQALELLGEVFAQDGPTAARALRHREVARLAGLA